MKFKMKVWAVVNAVTGELVSQVYTRKHNAVNKFEYYKERYFIGKSYSHPYKLLEFTLDDSYATEVVV